MRGNRHREGERGQAFTLEAIVGALVVLTAFLFALQSIVITPTTTAAVDPGARADLRQQAEDVMRLTEQNETTDLSFYLRNWNWNQGMFAGEGALNPDVGYGTTGPPGVFGVMLNETFTQRSRSYNIEVFYLRENRSEERGRLVMVDRGTPAEGAVVASRMVVLYDNQTLTASRAGSAELWQYETNATGGAGQYPIPDVAEGPVYNVVEVRLTVW